MGHIGKYRGGDTGGNDGGGERQSDSGCFENIRYWTSWQTGGRKKGKEKSIIIDKKQQF